MKQVTFRIEAELKKKAKKYAKISGRSLSGLIRFLLRQEVERFNELNRRNEL